MEKVAAVIVAGGSGKRMKSSVKKQYILLEDKEILAHTVQVFQNDKRISEIILVVGKEDIETVKENIVTKYGLSKVIKVVEGGKERQDSVYNGLMAVSSDAEYVMIHDGARPFIKEEILTEVIKSVIQNEAVIVAVPVKDTIKKVSKASLEVESTPKRDELWAVQTPQAFKKQLLMKAYQYALKENLEVTDDSMLVEAYGKKVKVVMGDYTNIKITTPEDLILGESILKSRKAHNNTNNQ